MLQFSRRKLWNPSGQVKPTGLPTIDWTHPLASGLVAYGIDTGWNFYAALTPLVGGGYSVNPKYSGQLNGPNVNAVARAAETTAPTPYGSGILWQGHTWSNGDHGWFFDANYNNGTNPINDAMYLIGKPAGVGNSLVCGFMRNGTSPYQTAVFGRAQTPDTSTTNLLMVFMNTDGVLQANCANYVGVGNTNYPPIGNSVTIGIGIYYTAGITIVNTSTSASTGSFYLQGQLQGLSASLSNVTTGFNTAPTARYPDAIQTGENDLAFGGSWHEQAPGSSALTHVLQGFAYWGGLWNRPLSPAEHVRLHWDPYCFLLRRQ